MVLCSFFSKMLINSSSKVSVSKYSVFQFLQSSNHTEILADLEC